MSDVASTVTAPRYLQRFSCLAGACPDTCCQSWRIDVDEEHFRRLEATLLADPGEAERFHRTFQPDPQGKAFRLLVVEQGGFCAYLQADKTCEIHAKHGEPLLGNTCSTYPRALVEVGGKREAHARLSCPEAARLCLLTEDALVREEHPPSIAGRGIVAGKLSSIGDDPIALLPVVREAMRTLLDRQATLQNRLFYLGYLATRLDALHASFTASREAVARERASLDQPAAQAQLDRSLAAALAQTAAIAPHLVVVVLSARLQATGSPGWRQLAQTVLAGDLRSSGVELTDLKGAPMQLGAARLGALHAARVAQLSEADRQQLDAALLNLVRFVVEYDYFRASSLLAWWLDLLVRLCLVRYFAIARLSSGATVGDAVVEATYKIDRAFDHDRAFVSEIGNALAQSKMSTLAHGVSLLKF